MATPEYNGWWSRRVKDNIPRLREEDVRPIEEHLQVVPSEMEIIKQDFEKRSLELERKIEQLEEEKMQLGLDVDVQKLDADKLRKGKNKTEEDFDSLKTDYKKLRRSMRTAGLGKTSEQWRQEIQEERTKVDQWEKKFHDTQAREITLKESLLVCQNEKAALKVRVAELEKSLHQHRSRNSAIELKASLGKIEELKERVGELEDAIQNSELRIELLERGNEQWQEQFHRSQNQIRERDYIMGEAVA
ncbi:WEB family protein At1g12150-like [Gossypium raimondii]|uniref:WEB family protein At1g12150-like n=1 Tax=Gossypium raimondii TaxID=29730 RepID=UPI00063AFE94|nr:WEB family protein At1g12150-like [Gossypium raimondii]